MNENKIVLLNRFLYGFSFEPPKMYQKSTKNYQMENWETLSRFFRFFGNTRHSVLAGDR